MDTPGYVNVNGLSVEALNILLEKGERFYATYEDSPIFDDSLWTTDYAFWGGGESDTPGVSERVPERLPD